MKKLTIKECNNFITYIHKNEESVILSIEEKDNAIVIVISCVDFSNLTTHEKELTFTEKEFKNIIKQIKQ